MKVPKKIKVFDLSIDLSNYRTVPQLDEEHATNALISIHPDYFMGLMQSLLDDGYSPTENIIVLETGRKYVVKEGNRRTASLKLIHGFTKNIDLPSDIQDQIDNLKNSWKTANTTVPCIVYPAKDAGIVDKLVARTHAKGNTSGRDKWNSVATARHARDQLKKPEPGLDLLEAYLVEGKNLSRQQAEEWPGDYPLTVLTETLQKLVPILKARDAAQLASSYPRKNKNLFDGILFAIGIKNLMFKDIRDVSQVWVTAYGLTTPIPAGTLSKGSSRSSGTAGTRTSRAKNKSSSTATYPSNDPGSVQKKLASYKVKGLGREKVAMLLNEIRTLKLGKHPHAFCFLLRSLFELSAKAYCVDHKKRGGPDPKKKSGLDKPLAVLLKNIVKHLTDNEPDKAKALHGAIAELAKKEGLLSVTSMNQLVHHPSFSISPPDICILFGNVFPLLEELNG